MLRQALDWTSMHISRGAEVSVSVSEVPEGGKSMWASATASFPFPQVASITTSS